MDYSLKSFEYDKSRKQLKAPTSKFVYGSFPPDLIVQSHVTGVRIQFRPIGENHPLFDQDQWDGEQRIYEPIPEHAHLCPSVTTLVIYNS